MKIGMRVPCYRSWCKGPEVRAIAQTVENLGFDSLWVQDHLVAPVGPAEETEVLGLDDWMAPRANREPMSLFQYFAGDDWWLDPFAVWGYLAAVTERVQLASDIIVVPYRNPIVQAKMIGTLDVLSAGRMIIGTGSGHVPAESRALGLDFDARAGVHDEYIRVIKALLEGPEASFDGEFVSFGTVRTLIRTVQQPHPPIYVGGNGRRAIRRAVELGDGWLPSETSVEGLARGIELLRETCEKAARSRPITVGLSVPNAFALAVSGRPSSSRPYSTPDEVIDALQRYERIGVEHVSLALPMPNASVYLDQIELFGREVLPAFR